MISIALRILMVASFIVLSALVWRFSKQRRWRVRSIIYGWGAFILWALIWALLLPLSLRHVMDSQALVTTFPEGTWVPAFVFGGWLWPAILVELSNYREFKKRSDDRTA